MKLFKRSVESKQYKRAINKFYKTKVAPILLSIKHFFKSSHKFFLQHPRLRICSIVGGLFLAVVAISVIFNTFSLYRSNPLDNGDYNSYREEYWNELTGYTRPSRTLEYKDSSYSTGTCSVGMTVGFNHNFDIEECQMAGTGSENDPYLIESIEEFMYVRTGGRKVLGKFFKVANNLDFTGVDLPVSDNGNTAVIFAGSIDGDFKHIKGINLSLSASGTLGANGLIPAIMGDATHPSIVKNFILDDATINVRNQQTGGIRAIGAMVGHIGLYAYALNNGLLSGTVNVVDGVTADSTRADGLFVGSLYGCLADFTINDDYKGRNGNPGVYTPESEVINGIVNSYSYANINLAGNVSGRVKIGGVLGYKQHNVSWMNAKNSIFLNSAYYGEITKNDNYDYQFVYNAPQLISSSISPFYGYYWYKGDRHDITVDYNSWAIAEDSDYLQSDGFVANFNSYVDLVNFYFHDAWQDNNGNVTTIETSLENSVNKVEWYISNTDFGDYRPYFPIIRARTDTRPTSSNATSKTVDVTFNANGHGTSNFETMHLTNIDQSINDYTQQKITLPFAIDEIGTNMYNTNSSTYYVFNGWRLTSITANGQTYTAPGSLEGLNYNYTARDTALGYSKNTDEVFAEGGYYLVPEGTTAITFTAVWARAVFVADEYNQLAFDRITYRQNSSSNGYGRKAYRNTQNDNNHGLNPNDPVAGLDQAYSKANDVKGSADMYGIAIVLVGNVHYSPQASSTTITCDWVNNNVDVTIRSIDNNDDKKPDYSVYARNLSKMTVGSVRFDFVNLLGIPQVAGYSGMLGSFYIASGKSFETTETVVTDHITIYSQNANHLKILGGYFDIFSMDTGALDQSNHCKYIIFGGTAYSNIVSGGNREANKDNYPPAINIVGGRAKLVTAQYIAQSPTILYTYVYIDSGYIDSYYSLYRSPAKLRVITKVNHGTINNYYGGGFSDTSNAQTGIKSEITNSRIGTVYGGPQFGKVEGNLELYISKSEIDYVYAGGYGGTQDYYFEAKDVNNTGSSNGFNSSGFNYQAGDVADQWIDQQTYIYLMKKNYVSRIYSENGVVRNQIQYIYTYLSLAKTKTTKLSISDSRVNYDIYGGANKGKVEGDIHIDLHNVSVGGSIYGAGYTGAIDKVYINESSTLQTPVFINYAMDAEVKPENEVEYSWYYLPQNYSVIDTGGKRLGSYNYNDSGKTTANNIYINISGDNTGTHRMHVEHDVFGGSNMAELNINSGGAIHVNIYDGVQVDGSIFGGGKEATVNGDTLVIVNNTDPNNKTKVKNVYASGDKAGVTGKATVIIAGDPDIKNVFGGGNEASTNETNVYIEGGNIENVFGGSDSGGVVQDTRVYVGKHANKQMETGKTNSENEDLCAKRALGFKIDDYGKNGGGQSITIYNNLSNIDFKEYTMSFEFTDGSKQTVSGLINTSWIQNLTNTYSNGVYSVYSTNRYDPQSPNILYHNSSKDNNGIRFVAGNNNNGQYYPIQIAKVSFEGYDTSNNRYSMTDCAASEMWNLNYYPVSDVDTSEVKYDVKLSDTKVDNIFGGNNLGGRSIKTNILVFPGNYDTSHSNGSYDVQVGNVFGGGNETQTGPDVECDGCSNIQTYKRNSDGWQDFNSAGWKFVPEYKSRIVIYGGHVTGDVYGGGKGNEKKSENTTLSAMYSTPMVLVTNNAQIDGNVYGGGYATNAPIGRLVGTSQNPDYELSTFVKPMVFIDWGTVNKNVYGGGYGDVVNGGTMVYGTLFNPYNISTYVKQWYFQMVDDGQGWQRNGKDETDENSPYRDLTTVSSSNHGTGTAHVHIKGSMYGGGERGAKENAYDYTFESVIDGTTVYLQEEKGVCELDVDGDVFGSGNFSSSAGYSDILILNIGSQDNPKKMKSIQRAEHVYINGSYIELSGGTDITNKFNRTKYSFSRIGKWRNGEYDGGLHLGDNTTLYLKAQANMVNNLWSSDDWTWMKDNGWTFLNPNNFSGSFEGGLNSVQFDVRDNRNRVIDADQHITVDGVSYHVVKKINNNTNGQNARINRIYLLDDHGLNIIPTEDVQNSFGAVHGMTFFGVYEENNNGQPVTTYYGKGYDVTHKTSRNGLTKKDYNAYILSGHSANRNVDGFITNVYNPDDRIVYTVIVDPTPENEAYHYWTIGNPVIAQEITLTASKYIRSGMKGVTLYNYAHETYNRIIFEIASIDVSGLTTEANFIDPKAVPTLAADDEDALKNFGLNIETSDAGWVNEGYTYFESDYNGGDRTSAINGTLRYEAAGAADFPTLIFNLENSRNIKSTQDLGYVTITINAHAFTPDDEITSVNSTFKIRVNMDTYDYDDNEYESSMAPGKHYRPFLSAPTNITANSEFSTYFNMYAYGVDLYQDIKEKQYADVETVIFDHVLYSTYVFPAGTRITMLDISTNDPKYYYYIVKGDEVLDVDHHKKTTDGSIAEVYEYPLSWFTSMDSTTDGDTYDEEINRSRYVVPDGNTISTAEQFIFTIDFKDVQTHTKPINQIRNEEVFMGIRTTIEDVAKIQADPMYETMQDMHFGLYDSNAINFRLDLLNTPTADDTIYVDDTFVFDANVTVKDDPIDNTYVRNTNYYQDRLGLRLGLYHITEDDQGNERATLVSGDELAGAIFYVNGLGYASGANGFVRLKMADYVVTVLKDIRVDLTNAEHLTSGLYEFRVTAFASADGLYAKQGDSITNSTKTFRVYLVNEHYGLSASIDDDKDVIVYSNGKTSGGTDTIESTINYFGSYGNPNVRITLKRRDYTTVESYTYNDVNFADYFDVSSTTFSDTSQLDRTDLFDTTTMTISKDALASHITSSEMGTYNMSFKVKNTGNLPTGTYRITYTLYNGDKPVGDVYTYIIIKD